MQVYLVLQRAWKARGFCKAFTRLSDVPCQISLAVNFGKPLCNTLPTSSLSLLSLEQHRAGGGRRRRSCFSLGTCVPHALSLSAQGLGEVLLSAADLGARRKGSARLHPAQDPPSSHPWWQMPSPLCFMSSSEVQRDPSSPRAPVFRADRWVTGLCRQLQPCCGHSPLQLLDEARESSPEERTWRL